MIGRREERAELRDRLRTHRMVTVTGAPGVGKTRLVRETAGDLQRAFPGGVRWLAVDEVTGGAALGPAVAGLLEALGRQPPWSDLPFVVLTSSTPGRKASRGGVAALEANANVTLIERPVHVQTLMSATHRQVGDHAKLTHTADQGLH